MTVHKVEKDILEIKYMNSLTTTEKVTEAIKNNIRELAGALKVTVTGISSREQKMVIVEINVKGAEVLLKSWHVKVS